MNSVLFNFGKYLLFLRSLFLRPERIRIYITRFFVECNYIGIGSLGIVAAISLSIGAVTTIQTAYQMTNGLIGHSIIASILRDSTILEFAPTITCLVLAGKVGANIASELGNMSVSEQIDALEVMGINSSGYLALPKIVAAMFIIPMLIFIAMCLSIFGGYLSGMLTGILTPQEFSDGIHFYFRGYTVFFSYIKSVAFSFLITSISAYHGYYTQGGALEVGHAGTKAVVYSCVSILIADYILSQLML